jgi:hypothetical protein
MKKGDASLSELLDLRDEILTSGSDAFVRVRRDLLNERSKLADLEIKLQMCSA